MRKRQSPGLRSCGIGTYRRAAGVGKHRLGEVGSDFTSVAQTVRTGLCLSLLESFES